MEDFARARETCATSRATPKASGKSRAAARGSAGRLRASDMAPKGAQTAHAETGGAFPAKSRSAYALEPQ